MDTIGAEIDRLIGIYGVEDPAVAETMVSEYSALVYRLALSILGDPADAQDAVQDTFMQAAQGLHRYQVGSNFKAWLLKIALNNCRMTIRKRRARRALQQAWDSFIHLAPRPPGPEAQVTQDEARSELWDLVDGLDEKHRLVVILRLAHEMSIGEISQVLGISEKTVYTRLYDALARLRGQMRLRPEFDDLWDEVRL